MADCVARDVVAAPRQLEKLNAMSQHGRLNSRMKDSFDIGLLAGAFDFEGAKGSNWLG